MVVSLSPHKLVEHGYFGPPPFFTPSFTIPRHTIGDLHFALSKGGHILFEEWFDQANFLNTATEWVKYLCNFSLLAHYDRAMSWDNYLAGLQDVCRVFCASKFADKFPVALYWPNALSPLLYFSSNKDAIAHECIDLAQQILKHGDAVTRASTAGILNLCGNEGQAMRIAAILVAALTDLSAPVRAEAALSLIKLGCIPSEAYAPLVENLNSHTTLLPAASALFHLTGIMDYFTILQEVAESNDHSLARATAYALDPWPTRQCCNPECHHPMSFQDAWMSARRHSYPKAGFTDVYMAWQDPSVEIRCNGCTPPSGPFSANRSCQCMQVKEKW